MKVFMFLFAVMLFIGCETTSEPGSLSYEEKVLNGIWILENDESESKAKYKFTLYDGVFTEELIIESNTSAITGKYKIFKDSVFLEKKASHLSGYLYSSSCMSIKLLSKRSMEVISYYHEWNVETGWDTLYVNSGKSYYIKLEYQYEFSR